MSHKNPSSITEDQSNWVKLILDKLYYEFMLGSKTWFSMQMLISAAKVRSEERRVGKEC